MIQNFTRSQKNHNVDQDYQLFQISEMNIEHWIARTKDKTKLPAGSMHYTSVQQYIDSGWGHTVSVRGENWWDNMNSSKTTRIGHCTLNTDITS